MGNWNISITGVGVHHNDKPGDADRIAQEAVDRLKAAGHSITHASFTHGGGVDLHPEPAAAATPPGPPNPPRPERQREFG